MKFPNGTSLEEVIQNGLIDKLSRIKVLSRLQLGLEVIHGQKNHPQGCYTGNHLQQLRMEYDFGGFVIAKLLEIDGNLEKMTSYS